MLSVIQKARLTPMLRRQKWKMTTMIASTLNQKKLHSETYITSPPPPQSAKISTEIKGGVDNEFASRF